MTERRRTLWAALVGGVTAITTLATAEVVSLFLGGIGNPILAVGSAIVDLVPPAFKTLVIDLFDTADKLVLFISLGLVVLVFAVVAGIVQSRRGRWGEAVIGLVAVIAIAAAVTRAGATPLHAIPTLAGAALGILTLRALTARLELWRGAPPAAVDPSGSRPADARATLPSSVRPGVERRRFLRLAITIGVVSAVVGAGARIATAAATAVGDLRAAIRLPRAAAPAPAIPADATLDVEGISPFVTSNDAFYRIDTALQVPSVDPREWTLRITGMVENDVTIDFDELLALPMQESLITLACVSNQVGGGLIGNAMWLGYPIRELLARARPMPGADMVLSTSIDGFTASTPLEVLLDESRDALLAVGMNGEPLPLQHGFPVRMVVPGLYGYVSATKWVVSLEVTRFSDRVAYWTPRGWSERGPIKLSSRIDTPTARASLRAGTVVVAGMAWAQHIGIERVEVRIDGGEWRDAQLARTVSVDTWVQWAYEWDADAGDHVIEVRATDSNGLVQTEEKAPVAPDGATGLDSLTVNVS
ncbi:oxidoreductase [Marisediminicola antarctica]|uniref:Oxidoreductase n=2 Tax=Marisediminicola antarctica TaxID=674079 RepID=A0A7L5ALZ5_9MICO|nr:molybdopterin-dependent oxidoreductase [Marisediminicola antarctica]QHO69299.1 oxidoreductase [Marisediminicola antarctica]